MTERISPRAWPRLDIELAEHFVERHRNDEDRIQQAQDQRRGREAVEHRAELANLDASAEAERSPTPVGRIVPASQFDPDSSVIGRHVTVRYPGPNGSTTLHSSVTDVSVDGDAVEIAAAPGHLIPLDNITFDDLDDSHAAVTGAVCDEPKAQWDRRTSSPRPAT